MLSILFFFFHCWDIQIKHFYVRFFRHFFVFIGKKVLFFICSLNHDHLVSYFGQIWIMRDHDN
ncbi:hypothetical protein ELZ30_09160 [Enterococcus faecium]|nr:hypothetical protein [Enterococcus faecium]HBR82567.1 hypothetical protein [Enterococcus sp.]EGP5147949.1 hypothetical protein [Enterococcus faecium]EGP5196435.1 hypothetical protein [Enterococcus faecium]EGP5213903.1 hypothetical protein [Enterococcus faecium]